MSKSLRDRMLGVNWNDATTIKWEISSGGAYEASRTPLDIALDNLAEDLLQRVYTLMMFREGLPSEGKVKAMFVIAFRKAMELSNQEVSLEKESDLNYYLRIGKPKLTVSSVKQHLLDAVPSDTPLSVIITALAELQVDMAKLVLARYRADVEVESWQTKYNSL